MLTIHLLDVSEIGLQSFSRIYMLTLFVRRMEVAGNGIDRWVLRLDCEGAVCFIVSLLDCCCCWKNWLPYNSVDLVGRLAEEEELNSGMVMC